MPAAGTDPSTRIWKLPPTSHGPCHLGSQTSSGKIASSATATSPGAPAKSIAAGSPTRWGEVVLTTNGDPELSSTVPLRTIVAELAARTQGGWAGPAASVVSYTMACADPSRTSAAPLEVEIEHRHKGKGMQTRFPGEGTPPVSVLDCAVRRPPVSDAAAPPSPHVGMKLPSHWPLPPVQL